MTEKDSLAIIGLLFTGPSMTFYGLSSIDEIDKEIEKREFFDDLLDYIQNLDLDYDFVKDVITGECGYYYHLKASRNSIPLPEKYDLNRLYRSEHDGQVHLQDNGKVRIGVWCEVDGFIAWLDEYKKVWVTGKETEKSHSDELKTNVLTSKIVENDYCVNLLNKDVNYTIKNAINKLGMLEDAEKEIGISLTTFIKALKNGIYVHLQEPYGIVKDYVTPKFEGGYVYLVLDNFPSQVCTKNYKKSWALTKEELL